VVSGEPPAETPLHLGCYRARPEIRSVAHFHPLAATAFATVGKPLITAFNAGAPFGKAVPVYDDPDLVRNDSQGSAMAKDLGKHRAVLLRGHGVAVVAEDVPSCVTLSLYLEENAKRLAYAMTIALRSSSPGCLDRIGGGTELVGCNVGHRRSLASGVRRVPRSSGQLSGCGIGMACRRACLSHRDFAAYPRSSLLHRTAGPRIHGPDRLEERQYVLSAFGRPFSEKPMM